MILCVRAWHRSPGRGLPIWLGIACGFKQTPWLVVPFAFVFWAHTAWARRNPNAFLFPAALFALVFVLPNVPFALWHPQAWLRGVTEPMSGGLIAFGSGLIQFTTSQYRDWQPDFYRQRLSLGSARALFWCSMRGSGGASRFYRFSPRRSCCSSPRVRCKTTSCIGRRCSNT